MRITVDLARPRKRASVPAMFRFNWLFRLMDYSNAPPVLYYTFFGGLPLGCYSGKGNYKL